jgi:hypothetical protein
MAMQSPRAQSVNCPHDIARDLDHQSDREKDDAENHGFSWLRPHVCISHA